MQMHPQKNFSACILNVFILLAVVSLFLLNRKWTQSAATKRVSWAL